MPSTHISDVVGVAVPVSDQQKALDFYLGHLGFEIRRDVAMGDGGRWIQVARPGAAIDVALVAGGVFGIDTGITFGTTDARADHAALADAGVDVDELLEWPGVPPMFAFRDIDGNQLKVLQV